MGKRIIKLKKASTIQNDDQLIIDNNNFGEAKSISFGEFKQKTTEQIQQNIEDIQTELNESIKPNIENLQTEVNSVNKNLEEHYVKNTDYTRDGHYGLTIPNIEYGTYAGADGVLKCSDRDIDSYNNANNNSFLSIGTNKAIKTTYVKEGLLEGNFTEEEQDDIKQKLGIKSTVPIYYTSESAPTIIHGQEVRIPDFSISAIKTLSRIKYLLDADYSTPMIIVWENDNQFYSFEYDAFCSETDSNKFGIIINYDKYRITYTASLQAVAINIQVLLSTTEYSALLDLIEKSLVVN